jgi:hypothetical protein
VEWTCQALGRSSVGPATDRSRRRRELPKPGSGGRLSSRGVSRGTRVGGVFDVPGRNRRWCRQRRTLVVSGRFTWNIRSRSRAAAAPPYETGLTQRGHAAASQARATQHQLPTRSPRPTTRPRSATDYTNLPIPYRLASGSRGGPCPRCPKLPVRPILPSVDAASRSHSNTGVPFHLRY